MTKRTKLHQTKCLRLQRMRSNGQAFKAGRRLAVEITLETLSNSPAKPKTAKGLFHSFVHDASVLVVIGPPQHCVHHEPL